MSTLGFDKYVEPLKIYLTKYREAVKGEKPDKKAAAAAASAASSSKLSLMMSQQQQLQQQKQQQQQQHLFNPNSVDADGNVLINIQNNMTDYVDPNLYSNVGINGSYVMSPTNPTHPPQFSNENVQYQSYDPNLYNSNTLYQPTDNPQFQQTYINPDQSFVNTTNHQPSYSTGNIDNSQSLYSVPILPQQGSGTSDIPQIQPQISTISTLPNELPENSQIPLYAPNLLSQMNLPHQSNLQQQSTYLQQTNLSQQSNLPEVHYNQANPNESAVTTDTGGIQLVCENLSVDKEEKNIGI
jgi:hypothetical protein